MSVKARFTYLKPYTHFPKRLSYVDINVPNQPLKYIRKQSVPCSRNNVFHATPLVFYQSIRGVFKVTQLVFYFRHSGQIAIYKESIGCIYYNTFS